MTAENEGDIIVFARLVNTDFLPNGGIRQTHECVTHPGVFIVCSTDAIGAKWSQHFEVRGRSFDRIEEAVAAASAPRLPLRDRLAEAIRRMLGLERPGWAELEPDHQECWRQIADRQIEQLNSFGLQLVETRE
jgi:hypothetical protein